MITLNPNASQGRLNFGQASFQELEIGRWPKLSFLLLRETGRG